MKKSARFKKARKAENLAKLLAYVADHPCVDCGETDPVVLQFDHVRGTKIKAVGTLFGEARAWNVIVAEIEKCEVRCSNCHWRKTAKQFGWYAYADPDLRGSSNWQDTSFWCWLSEFESLPPSTREGRRSNKTGVLVADGDGTTSA